MKVGTLTNLTQLISIYRRGLKLKSKEATSIIYQHAQLKKISIRSALIELLN